jgi:hypothetical protein
MARPQDCCDHFDFLEERGPLNSLSVSDGASSVLGSPAGAAGGFSIEWEKTSLSLALLRGFVSFSPEIGNMTGLALLCLL